MINSANCCCINTNSDIYIHQNQSKIAVINNKSLSLLLFYTSFYGIILKTHNVAAQFLKNGYKTEVTRFLLDGGVDIVLKKDEMLFGVQCKYLSHNRFVDTVDMLHFLGVLVNMQADGGFFVTTGKITAAGQDIAIRNGINIIIVR